MARLKVVLCVLHACDIQHTWILTYPYADLSADCDQLRISSLAVGGRTSVVKASSFVLQLASFGFLIADPCVSHLTVSLLGHHVMCMSCIVIAQCIGL